MEPSLFGQKHASRDYSQPKYWGKNMFNSSFPASLVAYMGAKGLPLVYLRLNRDEEIKKSQITASELYKIDPLSENAYYNFETGFAPYECFYFGKRETIDLVMVNLADKMPLSSFEIKLTALPDSTTQNLSEDEYGCEIVVRPPTICFAACSICGCYDNEEGRNKLKKLLSGIPRINHWEEADEVIPHYMDIQQAVMRVAMDVEHQQVPLIIQPVWKTTGPKMSLAEECLDVFVWSNLALLRLCCDENDIQSITRMSRTIIWVYRMLFDYAVYGKFDYERIVKNHSYATANDKAFALSGTRTRPIMECEQLRHPRVHKDEIKNIILGNGQNYLRPERRFDAVIVNTPNLFE